MPKFFSEQINDNIISIADEDINHIKKVLRLKAGDEILLCDGKGYDYKAVISDISSDGIKCEILEKLISQTEPNIKVTLYQGLPKASKMDYIIQKNTELGIIRIVPCMLSRCVVKLENKKAEEKKLQRWRKIAEEAAKQSGRGTIPEITAPVTLTEAINMLKQEDLAIALYECEKDNTLKKVLTNSHNAKSIGFIIGPEGGFDISEIEKIREARIPSIGLGKRILRTETAGEAVLSMIMYELGDINLN